MNVLSLFDGMSCGQIALERAGIKVDNYYASEIDKYAIKVTMANYPNTIQLGDVTKVSAKDLPKIDLLIGGSPCQGFSFAGKGLNFDDERSKLFFEFVRLKEELQPKYFLLENVQMKYEHELVISKYMKVNPIVINSSLVSAQNRVRNYWTNINEKSYGLFGDKKPDIPQPKDKGVLLKDVLESDIAEKYFISQKALERVLRKNYSEPQINPDKTGTLSCYNNSSKGSFDSGTTFIIDVEGNAKRNQGKAACLSGGAHSGGNHSDMDLIVTHNMLPRSSKNGRGGTGHLQKNDGKSYCLDTNQNTNAIEFRKVMQLNDTNGKQPYQQDRIYDTEGLSPTLDTRNDQKLILDKSPCLHGFEHGTNGQFNNQLVAGNMIRRLTEIECERLQTVPDNYTNHVSSTQRYKMLGNGWTVDVVAFILSHIPR